MADSERRKRVFELRMKLNQAKNKNHKAVVQEDERSQLESPAEIKRWEAKHEAERRKLEKEQKAVLDAMEERRRVEQELDDPGKGSAAEGKSTQNVSNAVKAALSGREEILSTSASDAAWLAKQAKKRKRNMGQRVDRESTMSFYKSYKRKTKGLEKSEVDNPNQKEAVYATGAALFSRELSDPTPEALNRLDAELEKEEKNRKKNIRRNEERLEQGAKSGRITHINEANKQYNKRLEKAFGSYTKNVKNNLERGTAL